MTALRSIRLTLRLTPEQQRIIDALPKGDHRVGVAAQIGDDAKLVVDLLVRDPGMHIGGEGDCKDIPAAVAADWGIIEEYDRRFVYSSEYKGFGGFGNLVGHQVGPSIWHPERAYQNLERPLMQRPERAA